MPDETPAPDLVERARGGDTQAFVELFEPLRERLLASIQRRMSPGIRQLVDPEDVLQDTFVRALHSLDRFHWQGDESLRRWLESIATHVTLDVIRHQGRRKAIRIDRDVQGEVAPPSRRMRRQERRERLDDALRTLSPDHRTVLELSRMEGLPIRDIADRMGRSESAVKNLLLRATRRLKESFGDTESLGLAGEASDETEVGDGQ